jgi:hypothetical protein
MPKKRASKKQPINNLVVISDTHCGCGLAIMPGPVKLDQANVVHPSPLQKIIKGHWDEFWGQHVPDATHGEPYAVVHNGDCIDGVHHNSTTQITHNLATQAQMAIDLMRPIVDGCDGRYYHIRGTEAHVGKSAEKEEEVAKALGALPNEDGLFARYDLWTMVGTGLVHLLHHIGTTGSQAYESTAIHKELVESFTEAGRWGRRPPDIIVRSHRHRAIETNIPTHNGKARAVVTACWQGKTPFVWKIPGGRISTPQFGGLVIRYARDSNVLFIRERIWSIAPSATEIIEL